MDKQGTLKVYQVIADLLNVGIFPGEVSQALVMAQQHVGAVISSLEADISQSAPKKRTPRKKAAK